MMVPAFLMNGPAPLPHGVENGAGGGHVVGGQFHDEGGRVAGEELRLLQDDAGADDGGDAHEVGRPGDHRGAAEDGAGDHGDKRLFGAAGNEGGGHDGHPPVPSHFQWSGRP